MTTETARLSRIVTTALDTLALSYRLERGVLHVDLPPEIRHHFSRKRSVSLTFDPDIWAIDRSLDLIVPGSQFLEALEEALKDRGAGQTVWIGGRLAGSPDLLEAWKMRFQVRGGSLSAIGGQSPQKRFLKLTYEVRLPSTPPRTELIPIVWDIEQAQILPPDQQGKLLARTWYGQEEAQGVLPDSLRPPQDAEIKRASKNIEAALQKRVAQAVRQIQSERAINASQELKELKRDLRKRLEDAEPSEAAAIQQEFVRRQARLKAWQTHQAEASLLSSTILFSFTHILQLEYAHTVIKQKILVTPRQRAGELLDAQCAWCDAVAPGGVLLLLPEPGEHPLACIRCGRACAEPTCAVVMHLEQHHITCAHCREDFRFCSAHDVLCPICSSHSCPDHSETASCCNEVVCTTHLRPHGQDESALLCTRHSQQCSIEQTWFPTKKMTRCPVTGKWLQRSRAVSPRGDARLLHPEAVIHCASSDVPVATDRARRCGYDNQQHHPSEMKRCAQTDALFCPEHRTETTWAPAQTIDIRRKRTCDETRHVIDVSQSGKCSASGKTFHKTLLVKCPISDKYLHHSLAISPPGDARHLHPEAVLRCASSGVQVATDRAKRCGYDNQWHHPTQLKACVHTRASLCPEHRVQTTWEPSQIIDIRRARTCSETHRTMDVTQAGVCSVSKRTFHKSLLFACPVTGKQLHIRAARHAPDDPSLLVHPAAIVRCVISKRLMVKTLARQDELTGVFPIHPTALSVCQLSNRQTARKHLTKLNCCGRMAAIIPKLPQVMSRLIRLSTGKWVCTDHYGMCTDGPHPVPRSALVVSRLKQEPYCHSHLFTCDCHGEAIHIGSRWTSPYEPDRLYCPRAKKNRCTRCDIQYRDSPQSLICPWCTSPLPLVASPPALQDLYKSLIKPRLPWYALRAGITVSGNQQVAVFEISGVFQKTIYRYDARSDSVQKLRG